MLNFFPFIHQYDKMDCGPACLRMIAKYYGKSYTMQELRDKCHISKQGVNFLGMSIAAEQIGFRTHGLKVAYELFTDEITLPCIIHWNQNHFVVCYRIVKKRKKILFKIADPAYGLLTYTEEEFKKFWVCHQSENEMVGLVLTLEPTPLFYEYDDKSADEMNEKKGLLYFFKYLTPYRKDLLLVLVCLVMASLLQLIFPLLTQSLVDVGIGTSNLNFIELILIAQLVLTISVMSVSFVQSWITLHVNSRINILLISDFLAKLLRLPLSYFDSKQIGDIMQRIGDHSRIQSFMTGTSINTLFSIWTFLIFGGIMASYSMTILLIFLFGNTLYVMWVLAFLKKRKDLDYKRFIAASKDQSNMIQLLTGIDEVKLNNCENQKRWRWEQIQIKLFKIGIKGLTLGQYQQAGSGFFTQITNITITFLIARDVVNGTLTLGMMMSVVYILGQLSGPINQIISLIQSMQDAKISLERLSEIHMKKSEDQDENIMVNEIGDHEGISIDQVSFSYTGLERNNVLKDVSFDIPKNKVTAIVGASGSGKTTLLKLLLGFYEPTQGKIKVGKNLLKTINPHVWRERTGAVLQDGFLFSDTIAENIAVEVEEIDYEKLEQAANTANLTEFIESLPLGYNTKIGMEGTGVSQGQKQRIQIARAVYKDPDYLFFDEATNALDAINERTILDNLKTFYRGKTVIIIAHRLSTVQNADKIIVLGDGQVLEEGTHNELTSLKGAYYNLVKNQLELGI